MTTYGVRSFIGHRCPMPVASGTALKVTVSCESDHSTLGGKTSPVRPPLHSNRSTFAVNDVDDGINRSAVLQTAGAPVMPALPEPHPTNIDTPIIASAKKGRDDMVHHGTKPA